MKFALSQQQYEYIHQTVVMPLQQKGAQIYCFGSRARGNHQPFSDLDLMIESESKQNLNIGQIQEQLQNGNFPFKVDLVHISDFADSYKSSYLQDRIPF